jgi:hypothetical protein
MPIPPAPGPPVDEASVPVTFLLFVTAALVAVSGGLKLRSTSRVGLGFAPLALFEMVVALALALLILPSPLTGTLVERWAVSVAILVVIVSSVDHGLRLRQYRMARAESEGGRLATYIKYLSDMDEAGESGAPAGPDADRPPDGHGRLDSSDDPDTTSTNDRSDPIT